MNKLFYPLEILLKVFAFKINNIIAKSIIMFKNWIYHSLVLDNK